MIAPHSAKAGPRLSLQDDLEEEEGLQGAKAIAHGGDEGCGRMEAHMGGTRHQGVGGKPATPPDKLTAMLKPSV